jgi:hypothetical protein
MSSELYRPLNMSFMNIVLTLVLMNKGLPTMDYSNIQSFLSKMFYILLLHVLEISIFSDRAIVVLLMMHMPFIT